MADTPQPQSLSTVACAIARWLQADSVPFVLIGGMAVSLAGRPRVTQDIDVLASVNEEGWADFVASGGRHGFLPRIADPVAFAHDTRVLPLRHETSGIDVDIVLAGMPFEEDIVANGHPVTVGDGQVRLPRTEDLIIMKAVARRPKDIADIEGLIDMADRIDWDYVSHWTLQFAEALETPEIQATIDMLRLRKG